MTNEEYIKKNKNADIRSLALKTVPEGVNALWCLKQIEGYQLAKKKLPQWAENDDIWYPPRLSMEQCSSELTALYKASIARQLSHKTDTLIDLTGGFGVDFSYMAKEFRNAVYVEQQEILCEAATHNMPLLGLPHAIIKNTDCENFIADNGLNNTNGLCIFLDPARRDNAGKKVYAIEDCTPNLTTLQDKILKHATYIIVKLSPMLDITQALRSLKCITDIHIVSVKGECKELLFVMQSNTCREVPQYHCVNLGTTDETFVCDALRQPVCIAEPMLGDYLYEPNASIMKAGAQDAFAAHYSLNKLHPMSNLFTSKVKPIGTGIPARSFYITHVYDFSKQSLKQLLKDTKQANIAIRNFPSTVADLRKRLKLKDGGNIYLFATTTNENKHILLSCIKNS